VRSLCLSLTIRGKAALRNARTGKDVLATRPVIKLADRGRTYHVWRSADMVIMEAARALAAGDALGALNQVALRDDAPALALRGIAMALSR
jgi:hypothetical protein